MTDNARLDRRRFVQLTGAAAATTFLAGCSGGSGDSGSGDNGSDGSDGEDGSDGGDGGDDGGSNGSLEEEPDYGDWFDGVDSYEATADKTGSDTVQIEVGAGDGLSFSTPAVAVSSGTTVVWEWTGQGGGHNVSAENGDFESETTDEEGFSFEYTFEETGIHKYACTPHRAIGMKGAVVVQ